MRRNETKLSEMAVGQNVTIPSTNSGTWNGRIVAIEPRTGQYAPPGEVDMIIRHDSGSVNAVRTNLRFSGYVNTADATDEMTDEEVVQAMPDIVAIILMDAVSAYPTEATPTNLDRIRQNGKYGKLSLEEALALPFPAKEHDKGVERADYADIKRLDYLFVNLSIQEYAELYHALSSEYTEDMVMYQLNQYNAGVTW